MHIKRINVLIDGFAASLSYTASFRILRYYKYFVTGLRTFQLLRSCCITVKFVCLLYWAFIEWTVQLQLLASRQACKFPVCSEIEKVNLIHNLFLKESVSQECQRIK